MKMSPRIQRRHLGRRIGAELVLMLAIVAMGLPDPQGGRTLTAQGGSPCALLMSEDLQSLAAAATIADGVSTSVAAVGFNACRYTWGEGTGRFKLDVAVSDASRMFAGKGPDFIKQGLPDSVLYGTADSIISDVGEAAVFKADSPAYVYATSYSKGRLLRVSLDGYDAVERKDQVISLLKVAASRL